VELPDQAKYEAEDLIPLFIYSALATLTRYGFVERTAQGTNAFYRIADPRVYQLCDLVCGQMAEHFAHQAQMLGASAPASRSKR
jgi:Fe2+ or Zn2+ uptake regulation protein